MGFGEENEQVGDVEDNADLLMMFSVMAEIRTFLSDAGLALRQGVVIFAEDVKCCNRLVDSLLRMGAVMCKRIGKSNMRVPNYLTGFHIFSRYDKADAIQEFLLEEDFTPAILTFGLLPEFLGNWATVIPFSQNENENISEILTELYQFRDFAHKNPDVLQRELQLFTTSEIYLQSTEDFQLKIVLEAAVAVFCCAFRNEHTEQETEERRAQLRMVVANYINLSAEYGEEMDGLDTVKRAVEDFVDENPQVLTCRYDEIDGEATRAIENAEAILFDTDWYYMPEKILRQACEPLLLAISFPHVKQMLYEEDILYCNNITTGNFTVKKLLTNSFGYTFRVRFLKIRREFFAPMGGLGLEERRWKDTFGLEEGNLCT